MGIMDYSRCSGLMLRSQIIALVGIMLMAVPAHAASWPSLPAACTPDRAAKWEPGKSENVQADCHCPPPTLCPTTFEQWTIPAQSPIPTVLARKCCPTPNCPAGTDLAGQPIPENFECNLPRCPAGSKLAGEIVPQDGNCNPVDPDPPQTGCPDKSYYVLQGGLVEMGLDQLPIASLPINKATPAIISAFGNTTRKVVGNVRAFNTGIQGAIAYYRWTKINTDPAVESAAASFIQACRGSSGASGQIRVEDSRGRIIVPSDASYGTSVTLRQATINGETCRYLDCGFEISPGEDTTCVSGDTRVTLADGSSKPAAEIRVGDQVKGTSGGHAIVAANRYEQRGSVFYSINDSQAMITDFHPIKTTEGWKIISPHLLPKVKGKKGFASTPLSVGDTLITEHGEEKVLSLEAYGDETPVYTYNFKLADDADFYANGIAVKGFGRMEMSY